MEKYQYRVDYFTYDMELIEKMYNIRVCGVPLSFYLLDLRKTDTYCHFTSDLLAYFIEGANRVEGEIPTIFGNDKGHSWVKKADIIYDTVNGLKWISKAYYEHYEPYNCIVLSKDSSKEFKENVFRK